MVASDEDVVGSQRKPAPMPVWEQRLVVASLVVHVADIFLDVLVLVLFFTEGSANFGIGSLCVVLWACTASSLYMSCGSGGSVKHDSIDGPEEQPRQRKVLSFLGHLSQVQIFTEAYRCLFHRHDGDFFHTLRLMEAILEAAPNSIVQLYALTYWPAFGILSDYGCKLLQTSVLVSFLSVGLSFSMFEQKVQAQTSGGYVICVALMRIFEIASRGTTLALFAAVTHPIGFGWALFLDYVIMVLLTVGHKSVRSSYSFFLSVPLVLMSYEPVVWRRQDHVVPKDRYYIVRSFEFVVLWIFIVYSKDHTDPASPAYSISNDSDVWQAVVVSSWCSSLGLLLTAPCIYRIARRHELARDGASNDPDFDPLDQDQRDFYSDSGSDGRDWESEDEDDDARAKDGLLSGQATAKDFDSEEQE